MQILVVNPGATSTKIAIFDDDKEIMRENIEHKQPDLEQFEHVNLQADYRMNIILEAVQSAGYDMNNFAAVVGRGGLLRHIPSGTYAINKKAVDDMNDPPMGEHASNLGILICDKFAKKYNLPAFFVDPVSVDELEPVARITGYAGFERQSFFHALNQKSVARRAAAQVNKPYEQSSLIVAHLGGGVSVAAHKNGRVIDMYNVKDEGSFAMDRAGTLPANQLIDFCFSGKTKQEVKREIGTQAGMVSYLGTRDLREVEAMVDAGDKKAELLFDALAYQLCKDIGSMAAVLCGRIDAIALTGGMAYSKKLCAKIAERVSFLAPILNFAGEEEMAALAAGALRVLRGASMAQEY